MTRGVATALVTAVAAFAPALSAAGDVAPRTAVASYMDIERVMAAEGVIEAVRQSTLASQVAGRIVSLPVRAGDRVRAGQVLVQIDARSASLAEAARRSEVSEAAAHLANARAKLARSEQLFERRFVSQAALDQARAEYLAAQARNAAAMANAGEAATSTSLATISAPFAGVVAAIDVEVGDMALPGRPLVTIFDPSELRVTAILPQAVLADVQLDAAISVEIPALSRSIVARGATVLPLADTRTHTTRVRLALPRTEGILPGQYARALFVRGRVRALSIPASAVLRRSEVTAVYVVDAVGAVRLRHVRIGEPTGDGRVQVLAGVMPGERVAVEPVRAGIEASRPTARRS
jgi:RND family efflux transporter MFP subunit